jgi:hypothetical protein
MPAKRTTANVPITASPGDMLAKSNGASDLMVHAMLLDEENPRSDVTIATQLRIAHMGPPLGNATRTSDAVGGIGLSKDQSLRIKKFIAQCKNASDKRKEEYRKRDQKPDPRELYVILPSAKSPNKDFTYWRFSCTGFVLKAYEQLKIVLLKGPIPHRTLDELKAFYPFFAQELDKPDTRAEMGIGTGDSWPVELVGYLLHSFARSDAEIIAGPYAPQLRDEYFPRQSSTTEALLRKSFGKEWKE